MVVVEKGSYHLQAVLHALMRLFLSPVVLYILFRICVIVCIIT